MIRLKLVIASLGLLLLIGCSDPTKGIVSGTITVDGQLAETGAISFIPLDGRSTTSGGVIKDGKYTVEASVAKVRVEIRVPKVVGEKKIYDTPDSPVQKLMDESLPAKFNDESELTYDIPSGKSTKDFSLSTSNK